MTANIRQAHEAFFLNHLYRLKDVLKEVDNISYPVLKEIIWMSTLLGADPELLEYSGTQEFLENVRLLSENLNVLPEMRVKLKEIYDFHKTPTVSWSLKSIGDPQYLTDHHNRQGECLVYCPLFWDRDTILGNFLEEDRLEQLSDTVITKIVDEIFADDFCKQRLTSFLYDTDEEDLESVLDECQMIFLLTWEFE